MKRLYDRTDEWLKSLSQGKYAVALGTSAGVGVLVVGLLVGDELVVLQAVAMAVVIFGLESVFGLHQTSEKT